ncbi:coiled-coil domain-containing protein 148 isoform X2 [Gallus gallus]|uniref:coiled-coil domain-containing protein 148 isoform X2 n=1 Tax=Gallus gallus TaxID=9031 RepID=UPI001F008A11|nr:coiled-coil domain-containing protein 148 isoform X2 [Gallus gallus]XP_046799797.1 coiled-coil domain-containing protein 148 isoform X2 [Gallus gallus]
MSTAQRIRDVENLVNPMRNAPCSQKYKPIDYKHLCELTAAEKVASTKIQFKIKKVEQISKINKEQMLLKQHCQVWWREYKRLSENREKAEAEIQTLLDEGSHKYDFFLDMWDLEHKLSQERDAYQTDTVAPIWQLRENLKFWLTEMQHYVTEDSSLRNKFSLAEKLQQIESVKKEWKTNLEFLNLESLALERELQDYKIEITHEKAWDHYNFFKNQRRVLILNWTQARKAFFLKAVMAVAEASAAQEAEAVSAGNRRKQQEICVELKAKVLQWRAQQEEAAELEAAVAARRKEKEDEKERIQKEQEMIHRAQEKEKVKKYLAEKQLKWQEQEEKELQHLKELRKLMAKQAVKDRERVKFRQALLERRILEKKEEALREAHAAEEKEKCLEALRQKVSVVAKPDPARVVADTAASKARMGVGTTEEFVLQKPLFQLQTYSEEQIISDPRLRVELALREAGLHKTLYAKEILPKIPPLKLPRRDTESTVFKM